eukprot:11098494-Ditylum_brightwellii.AAC.2
MVKKHGGKQRVVLKGGIFLPLNFNGHILAFDLQPPTPEELMTMEPNETVAAPEEETDTNPVNNHLVIGS